MNTENDRILVLTGPTAVGKTALSLELAERLNGEIISADSRQVYRFLDIGTAKPSADELERVTHHFIDELDPGEPFSAGAFARAAWDRMSDIRARGRIPIVAGGSTLYLQALQEGLADIPVVSADVRTRLTDRLEREGSPALFAELERIDPTAASTMDPTKSQRIVRALEVYYGTGAPLSSYFKHQPVPPVRFATVVLFRERDDLYTRIERRVDDMLAAGLVEEVRSLIERGVDPSWNPLRTIGYQEPLAYVCGSVSLDTMVELIKRNTRRYAKRQLTWFRRFASYQWVDSRKATPQLILEVAGYPA